MEVTALCVTLLINGILAADVTNGKYQKYDPAFPHIDPNRLQFFQNESITVNCEDFDELHDWRVRWKLKKCRATNHSSSTSCYTIESADPSHSGKYWCEDEKGERSNAVNITVVAGEVILDIPPPVMEGDNVTLRCQTKKTLHLIAEFYKDGNHVETGYKGEMAIHNVSVFDQGLYKCSISGAGESPKSWLTVRDPQSLYSPSSSAPALPWILITVTVAAQLLVLVVLDREKRKGTKASSPEERDVYSSVYYRSVTAETTD